MEKPISIQHISFIGSGNVATNLAIAFHQIGIDIHEIHSSNPIEAEKLASLVDSRAVPNIKNISDNSDLYILAVPDDDIKSVSNRLPVLKGIVVHSSGITPLNVLADKNNNGVFYPLQTLTKTKTSSLEEVPICIESDDDRVLQSIKVLAHKISNRVIEISSDKRQYLHLAAVMVNNFTNHLYHLAEEILDKEEIDFSLLWPLIQESASKVKEISPELAQTGPAKRNDVRTIKKHIELLHDHPELKEIYNLISKQITNKYHE